MIIKNRRIAGFLVAVSMLVTSGPGMAAKEVQPSCGPPGTWCSLGKVTAGRDKDRDTIEIKGSNDEFRALKFKVKDSPINIHRMVVTYDNGSHEEINTRNEIPKGGESRNIDLRGFPLPAPTDIVAALLENWAEGRWPLGKAAAATLFEALGGLVDAQRNRDHGGIRRGTRERGRRGPHGQTVHRQEGGHR